MGVKQWPVWIASFSSLLFACLAWLVSRDTTLSLDTAVLQHIRVSHTPFWDDFYELTTRFGAPETGLILGVLVFAIYMYRKHPRRAVLVLGTILSSSLLAGLLKLGFARLRPELWVSLAPESSFAFPSGHAVASMALACLVIYCTRYNKWRLVIVICAALYVLAIAYSRLYLGVHYPTDIAGGWLLSITCFSACLWFVRHFSSNNKHKNYN